ncbi:amidotransferase 1, exosortase A system-associated [Halieaceae bacterium IMCC14734]|uniref:asparagine synthase (glutamine-hydrolyzing) n=1 Tax=Candidatus Litorirhabdus singularis TaxID=2518993 RepID=A0ABT3TG68_9GAMM|nr:XrtA/PEP-CTERM system amidotransferase [Candidatus Litorirhabdus singularis]MCX2981293.1 amidotransferase 1, exosortase A system-associated [Candidatus Litorirhabdus singularis]
MCGIAGMFDLRGRQTFDAKLLHAMNEAQFHRGPDEGGTFLEAGVALGHRRLSIIDLSSGQQPMSSADGDIVVVFNGEIYNFRELAEELKARGHLFKTRCDTEVILYAWREWGERCVDHFRGMFAFAIYDRKEQSLFLARDRLGIKPLYYAILSDGQLIFGSELKVLAAHPGMPRILDPFAMEDYFSLGYIPEPRTMFTGVQKLHAGHTLYFKRGLPEPTSKQYWDVSFTPHAVASEEEWTEELIRRMRDAVDVRMVAEVPLGSFLSGGVDSSAVVAMMAQLQSDPVNTCAIGFDVAQYDETDFARMVADRYQTNHFERVVDSDDFDLLDTLAHHYDEPFADSSALPTYRVCQLARQQVTVALSGDGGDENFAGYRRHRWHMNEEALRSNIPQSIRGPLFGLAGAIYPKADWAPKMFRAKSTLQSLARSSVEAYLHSVSITTDTQRQKMFSASMHSDLQGYRSVETFNHYADNAPTDDPLSLIQYIDLKTYLCGDILTKVDRASMAHALEVRVPLLDHHFVEWVSGLPPSMKLRGQEGKYLLKKSLEPHLPNDVLYRDKMGFGVPLANWFRGPLKQRLRDSIADGGLADTGYFDRDYLKKLVKQHESGQNDHSAALWSLLMFEASMRTMGVT